MNVTGRSFANLAWALSDLCSLDGNCTVPLPTPSFICQQTGGHCSLDADGPREKAEGTWLHEFPDGIGPDAISYFIYVPKKKIQTHIPIVAQ